MSDLMSSVRRGVSAAPLRIVLYGVEGIGKTTFAAGAPSPVFLGSEDGFGTLDVPRLPPPESWAALLEWVSKLTQEKHTFRTLVLDTLDWLEPLCWAHVCEKHQGNTIEDVAGGYGKGYLFAVDEWRWLLRSLDRLRQVRGMHVVCLAHAEVKTFTNPEGTNFDRYQLRMHQKSAAVVKEWCDVLLFANHEVVVKTQQRGDRALLGKGKAQDGGRMLFTERRPAYDAKNRYSLPAKLPLAWERFAVAMKLDERAGPPPADDDPIGEDGHRASWSRESRGFFAELKVIAERFGIDCTYDLIAEFCESVEIPRPSGMTRSQRAGLLAGLKDGEKRGRYVAFLRERSETVPADDVSPAGGAK